MLLFVASVGEVNKAEARTKPPLAHRHYLVDGHIVSCIVRTDLEFDGSTIFFFHANTRCGALPDPQQSPAPMDIEISAWLEQRHVIIERFGVPLFWSWEPIGERFDTVCEAQPSCTVAGFTEASIEPGLAYRAHSIHQDFYLEDLLNIDHIHDPEFWMGESFSEYVYVDNGPNVAFSEYEIKRGPGGDEVFPIVGGSMVMFEPDDILPGDWVFVGFDVPGGGNGENPTEVSVYTVNENGFMGPTRTHFCPSSISCQFGYMSNESVGTIDHVTVNGGMVKVFGSQAVAWPFTPLGNPVPGLFLLKETPYDFGDEVETTAVWLSISDLPCLLHGAGGCNLPIAIVGDGDDGDGEEPSFPTLDGCSQPGIACAFDATEPVTGSEPTEIDSDSPKPESKVGKCGGT